MPSVISGLEILVLRNHYNRRSAGAARRWVSTLAAGCLLAGCSLGARNAPITTGSVNGPVEVQRPLPRTLAYSDAAKIGQAARAVLWQAQGETPNEWVNARTGSSGTLTAARRSGTSDGCRPFSTLVTSLGGVHQYWGTLCLGGESGAVLRIEEDAREER